jgi:hypothetical protein
MQSRLNDARIVEDHQTSLRQKRRKRTEQRFADAATVIDKELATVAFSKGKLGDAVVGQGVIVVAYLYVFCVHNAYFPAKIRHLSQKVVSLHKK